MRRLKCTFHQISFRLPENEGEFLSGTLHDDLDVCHSHLVENPSCNLEEDDNER